MHKTFKNIIEIITLKPDQEYRVQVSPENKLEISVFFIKKFRKCKKFLIKNIASRRNCRDFRRRDEQLQNLSVFRQEIRDLHVARLQIKGILLENLNEFV